MEPTFLEYLSTRRFEKSDVGTMARDVLDDPRFSDPSDVMDLLSQLDANLATADVLNAAARAWCDFLKWRERQSEAA